MTHSSAKLSELGQKRFEMDSGIECYFHDHFLQFVFTFSRLSCGVSSVKSILCIKGHERNCIGAIASGIDGNYKKIFLKLCAKNI